MSSLDSASSSDDASAVIAVLLMLGISSGAAEGSAENGTTMAVLVLFMAPEALPSRPWRRSIFRHAIAVVA